ncbi:MAG: HAMP domain-containing sensor histidine kinase [Myxococcales bacterium]
MAASPPAKRGFSLTARVALASALAASLGGAVAALASGITARGLLQAHQNEHLLDAARELASEMREEFEEDDPEEQARDYGPAGRTLQAVLTHELGDVKLLGARAVLSQQGRVLAGDGLLARPPAGECVRSLLAAQPLRACSVSFDQGLLTLAASEERELEQLGLFGRAVLFGAVVGALLGWLLSRRVAQWVLAPLHELRDRVRAVHVDRVSSADAAHGLRLEKPSPGEVDELRQAIAQLVERLAGALEQARAFAAEAAHELRTPLTTIAGELELLAEHTEATSDAKGLARVRGQVGELSGLVERLLALARTADGLRLSEAELVDLSDVLALVREGFSAEARARLEVAQEDDVIVRGDTTLLRAMLGNALENAIKFSAGRVHVGIRRREGEAVIDVQDGGSGLGEVDRKLVFAPFFRAPSARLAGTPGHGMGLALIAAVAQAHGGSAEFLPAATGAHLRIGLPMWSGKVQP